MKKYTAIALILCLLLTVIGYQVLLQLQIMEARMEMKQHLSSPVYKKLYTDLVFNNRNIQEISWMDEDEFQWHGSMYDVVSKEVDGDRVIIRCIEDKKEAGLVDLYLRESKSEQTENHPSSTLLKLINSYYLNVFIEVPSSMQGRIFKKYKPYSFFILANFIPVSTPPPRVC